MTESSIAGSYATESVVSESVASESGATESLYGDDGDGDEGYVEVDLPEYACTYCSLSDEACVVKCVESGTVYFYCYKYLSR